MSDVPPKVPESEAELSRAICLLQLRTKSQLSKDERVEIRRLVGIYPTPAQATAWKQAFKRKISPSGIPG